ncbi:MAG: hypothetical protein AB8I08_13700 [Sandaracinaceae bacterium]
MAVLLCSLCLGLGSLGLGVSVAHATIVEALSLSELVTRSQHVVVVTCVGESTERDSARRIVTDYRLQVEDVMHGPSSVGDLLLMRSLGGVEGDIGMHVEGEPHLTVGGRYVVFLRMLSDGRTLRPVGMSQGVMAVQEEAGVQQVHPGGQGLALRQRVRGGQLIAAPPALLHPEPLDALRERVGAVRP